MTNRAVSISIKVDGKYELFVVARHVIKLISSFVATTDLLPENDAWADGSECVQLSASIWPLTSTSLMLINFCCTRGQWNRCSEYGGVQWYCLDISNTKNRKTGTNRRTWTRVNNHHQPDEWRHAFVRCIQVRQRMTSSVVLQRHVGSSVAVLFVARTFASWFRSASRMRSSGAVDAGRRELRHRPQSSKIAGGQYDDVGWL